MAKKKKKKKKKNKSTKKEESHTFSLRHLPLFRCVRCVGVCFGVCLGAHHFHSSSFVQRVSLNLGALEREGGGGGR